MIADQKVDVTVLHSFSPISNKAVEELAFELFTIMTRDKKDGIELSWETLEGALKAKGAKEDLTAEECASWIAGVLISYKSVSNVALIGPLFLRTEVDTEKKALRLQVNQVLAKAYQTSVAKASNQPNYQIKH